MLINAIIEKDEFGYFAYVPSLEGCVSQGNSFEEAVTNIKEAIELYIESIQTPEAIAFKHSAIVPIEVPFNA